VWVVWNWMVFSGNLIPFIIPGQLKIIYQERIFQPEN
jgi:hypothetical protein